MHKFLAFVRMATQEDLAYRAEKVIWTLVEFAGLVPIFSLWIVLGRAGKISPDQSGYLLAYYLIVLILSRLTTSDLEEWLIDDIKDGRISRDIIRPFSFHMYLFAKEFVWRMAYIFYIVPFVVALVLMVPSVRVVFLLPMVILIFSQRLAVAMLVAFSAFWIDQSKSLSHVKWMLGGLLGGGMLPLTFFPSWFQTVARWSPFYGWLYFPAQTVLGKLPTPQVISGLATSVMWTILLIGAAGWTWRRGLRHYGAVGG